MSVYANHSPLPSKWCVAAGPSCSGKTTTLEALEKYSFIPLPEVERELLTQRIEEGSSIEDARVDAKEFYHQALILQLRLETCLLPRRNTPYFFEMSRIDLATCLENAGGDPLSLLREQPLATYHKIFIFEPVPFVQDGFRTKRSEQSRIDLADKMEEDYSRAGYDPIRLPAISLNQRVKIVLEVLAANQEAAGYWQGPTA